MFGAVMMYTICPTHVIAVIHTLHHFTFIVIREDRAFDHLRLRTTYHFSFVINAHAAVALIAYNIVSRRVARAHRRKEGRKEGRRKKAAFVTNDHRACTQQAIAAA